MKKNIILLALLSMTFSIWTSDQNQSPNNISQWAPRAPTPTATTAIQERYNNPQAHPAHYNNPPSCEQTNPCCQLRDLYVCLCPSTPYQPFDLEKGRRLNCCCVLCGACANWGYFATNSCRKNPIPAEPTTCCFAECVGCYICCCRSDIQNNPEELNKIFAQVANQSQGNPLADTQPQANPTRQTESSTK